MSPPVFFGLVLLGLPVANSPALHGSFLIDDVASVTPQDLRSLRGLLRIWTNPGAAVQYYPILHSVFCMEHRR